MPQVVLLGSEKPASLRMLKEIPSRELPRLVLMLMTPEAAAVPYSVEPAAPFTTSTDSMSRPPSSSRLPLRMIVPSTTISGCWLRPEALIDVGPRIRICGVDDQRLLATARGVDRRRTT